MSNANRVYQLLRKLDISIDIADEVSQLMADFTILEQDIVYYWLMGYYTREIVALMCTYKGRVEKTISKFKALGKVEMCAISG